MRFGSLATAMAVFTSTAEAPSSRKVSCGSATLGGVWIPAAATAPAPM